MDGTPGGHFQKHSCSQLLSWLLLVREWLCPKLEKKIIIYFYLSGNCSHFYAYTFLCTIHLSSLNIISFFVGVYPISWLGDLLLSLVLAISPCAGGGGTHQLLELFVELGSRLEWYHCPHLLNTMDHRYLFDWATFPLHLEKSLLQFHFVRWCWRQKTYFKEWWHAILLPRAWETPGLCLFQTYTCWG